MPNPFPSSASLPGTGHITASPLRHAPQTTALTQLRYTYPLKLISPSATGAQKSVLVFLLSYGGGLVGGDTIELSITVEPSARLSIVTQGATKIFKPTGKRSNDVTRQTIDVRVAAGGALCLLPDPVMPFEGSVCEQRQTFRVDLEGSVCVLDWVAAGRVARGEEWVLQSWRSRNEVWVGEEGETREVLLVRDNVILEADHVPASGGVGGNPEVARDMSLKQRMHKLLVFGTLILRGPLVEKLASFFMSEFALQPRLGARDFRTKEVQEHDQSVALEPREQWRVRRLMKEAEDGVLWSVAKVRGCTVVKFGAHSVEGGRVWIAGMLGEEGSIQACFGEEALSCMK